MNQGTFNFNPGLKKIKKSYGRDPKDIELNGEKIFQNMDDMQQRRVDKVFGGTARCDQKIVETAHKVAEHMGFKTAGDLMSVIEIVAAEVKGRLISSYCMLVHFCKSCLNVSRKNWR